MWYYSINDRQHGPVSEQALEALLRSQDITPQTLVWCEGMGEQLPLEQTELAARFEMPQPNGDVWETCAYSGEKVKRPEMIQVDGFWIAKAHRDEAETFIQHGGRLPKTESGYQAPGNITLAHLFSNAWSLFRACAVPACAIYLLIGVPLSVVLHYTVARISPLPLRTAWISWSALILVGGAIGALAPSVILLLFSQHAHRRRVGFRQALSGGIRLWGCMAITSLLASGLSLSFVGRGTTGVQVQVQVPVGHGPGAGSLNIAVVLLWFVLGQRLFVATVAVVEGHRTPWKALKRSWQLTRRYFWATLGLNILLGILNPLCSWLLSSLLEWPLHAFTSTTTGALWKGAVPAWLQGTGHDWLSSALGVFTIYSLAVGYCYYQELQALFQEREAQHREDEVVRETLKSLGKEEAPHPI